MGFMDFFATKQKEKTIQTAPFTGQQQATLNQLLGAYSPQIGQWTGYPGTRVAPLTTWQQALLGTGQGLTGAFGGFDTNNPLWQAVLGTVGKGVSGELGAAKVTPEQTEQYFSKGIVQPSWKTMQEKTLPAVREAFGGPGYWGTPRQRAEMETTQDWQDWIGQQRAGLEWDTQAVNRAIDEAQAARQLSASQQALGALGFPTTQALAGTAGLEQLLGLATTEQAQQQREIQADLQKFLEQYQITDPTTIAILTNLLGLQYGAGITKTTAKQYPAPADIGAVIAMAAIKAAMSGGAGGAGAGAGQLFEV